MDSWDKSLSYLRYPLRSEACDADLQLKVEGGGADAVRGVPEWRGGGRVSSHLAGLPIVPPPTVLVHHWGGGMCLYSGRGLSILKVTDLIPPPHPPTLSTSPTPPPQSLLAINAIPPALQIRGGSNDPSECMSSNTGLEYRPTCSDNRPITSSSDTLRVQPLLSQPPI